MPHNADVRLWHLPGSNSTLGTRWFTEFTANPFANLLAIAPFPFHGPQGSLLSGFTLIPNRCGKLSNVKLHRVHGFLLML